MLAGTFSHVPVHVFNLSIAGLIFRVYYFRVIDVLLSFIAPQKALFSRKVSIVFLCLDKKHMLWYSLEASRRGASCEYPQHMFSSRNKKNIM